MYMFILLDVCVYIVLGAGLLGAGAGAAPGQRSDVYMNCRPSARYVCMNKFYLFIYLCRYTYTYVCLFVIVLYPPPPSRPPAPQAGYLGHVIIRSTCMRGPFMAYHRLDRMMMYYSAWDAGGRGGRYDVCCIFLLWSFPPRTNDPTPDNQNHHPPTQITGAAQAHLPHSHIHTAHDSAPTTRPIDQCRPQTTLSM